MKASDEVVTEHEHEWRGSATSETDNNNNNTTTTNNNNYYYYYYYYSKLPLSELRLQYARVAAVEQNIRIILLIICVAWWCSGSALVIERLRV